MIWATGYRADYSWIKLPDLRRGRALTSPSRRHRCSRASYFLGLTWQHTRGSALIGWVKDDAEYIAERIAEYQESDTRQPGETPVSAGAPPEEPDA